MTLFERFISAIVQRGTLRITYADGRVADFGTAAPGFPDVAIRFADARVPRDIVLRPDMGAGEAYTDGRMAIEGDDIIGLIGLLGRNRPWERGGGLREHGALRRAALGLKARVDRLNWTRRSKRNVAHHYDLDDRLYDLFLDRDRQYSCAYWVGEHDDLDRAQDDKKAHIAAKLALRPGQRVLDIGCGWGGMALYLARVADVRVHGITLSEEQLKVARQRAIDEGLADRVTFELIDYRDLGGRDGAGPFDRIVSVGMFEHVGPRHYRQFFGKCHDLLADGGVMLLHTIGRMGGPGTTDRWTAKYIFPGGYCPALSEIASAHEASRLICTDVEVLRLHYARTLRHWYARVVAARSRIEALYDANFFRMWQFYLAGSVNAFETGSLCNYQLQYTKDRRTLPITRDYIGVADAEYRGDGGDATG